MQMFEEAGFDEGCQLASRTNSLPIQLGDEWADAAPAQRSEGIAAMQHKPIVFVNAGFCPSPAGLILRPAGLIVSPSVVWLSTQP